MRSIIPAGGLAQRFGGIYKELLPVGDRQYLLSSAIRRAQELGADTHLVITSAEKAAVHARFLSQHAAGYSTTLQVRDNTATDLWAALAPVVGQNSLLILPDTVFTVTECVPASCDLAFGVFTTNEPYRFSVLDAGVIHTKKELTDRKQWTAWGCVYWSEAVSGFWSDLTFTSYDAAFQAAIDMFGYKTFTIDNYHDLGSWEAYQRYVRDGI